jgi:hypothetical protein
MLVPKAWVEGCRIGTENELADLIPQPKERRCPILNEQGAASPAAPPRMEL